MMMPDDHEVALLGLGIKLDPHDAVDVEVVVETTRSSLARRSNTRFGSVVEASCAVSK